MSRECSHSEGQTPPVEAFVIYKVSGSDQNDEYIARRPMYLSTCEKYRTELKRLTFGEENICFLGTFIGIDTDETGQKLTSWVFEKYKTHKGCDSYFEAYRAGAQGRATFVGGRRRVGIARSQSFRFPIRCRAKMT